MTGVVEGGRGVLWPCVVATRSPSLKSFWGPKGKRHLLVRLNRSIVLVAFTLAYLIRPWVHFHCTNEVLTI